MKQILCTLMAVLLISSSFAQKRYYTKTGTISFQAGTSVEDIDAINKSTTSIFDAVSGQLEFAVLIKGFEFKRALMQEHFNENYMESDKYPKSVFKGKINNIEKVNFTKDGTYPVTVAGTLDMHGVKQPVTVTGSFRVSGGVISSTSEFSITLEDYKIAIPGVVKDKISKTAKIKVNCSYTSLK